jgi:hypothetical protein
VARGQSAAKVTFSRCRPLGLEFGAESLNVVTPTGGQIAGFEVSDGSGKPDVLGGESSRRRRGLSHDGEERLLAEPGRVDGGFQVRRARPYPFRRQRQPVQAFRGGLLARRRGGWCWPLPGEARERMEHAGAERRKHYECTTAMKGRVCVDRDNRLDGSVFSPSDHAPYRGLEICVRPRWWPSPATRELAGFVYLNQGHSRECPFRAWHATEVWRDVAWPMSAPIIPSVSALMNDSGEDDLHSRVPT